MHCLGYEGRRPLEKDGRKNAVVLRLSLRIFPYFQTGSNDPVCAVPVHSPGQRQTALRSSIHINIYLFPLHVTPLVNRSREELGLHAPVHLPHNYHVLEADTQPPDALVSNVRVLGDIHSGLEGERVACENIALAQGPLDGIRRLVALEPDSVAETVREDGVVGLVALLRGHAERGHAALDGLAGTVVEPRKLYFIGGLGVVQQTGRGALGQTDNLPGFTVLV